MTQTFVVGEVPVFPLPGVVLFPGALLPLHIFEPRYRRMTEDVLASNRLLVMAQLIPGAPEASTEQPPLRQVAGLGEVVGAERLNDGRFNLLLRGRARVALDELPFRAPYRRARAITLQDTVAGESNTARRVLLTAAQGELEALRKRSPGIDTELDPELELTTLVDRIAQYFLRDPSEQQQLLETLDVEKRVSLCVEALLRQGGTSAGDKN